VTSSSEEQAVKRQWRGSLAHRSAAPPDGERVSALGRALQGDPAAVVVPPAANHFSIKQYSTMKR